MKNRDLLIHLKHDVDSFSIKSRHLQRIREAFPDIRLVVTADREEFHARLPEAVWLMTWIFRPEWYEKAPNLEAIFTPAAGHDWVTPDPTGRVKNFYGQFHGRIMRESLLAMMLYFNRRLALTSENRKQKIWDRRIYDGSSSLFSQHVLIVGYGAIGRQMAELLKAFGARITGVKRSTAGFETDPNAARVITFDKMNEALPTADHVVFVLPGGAETDDMFTEQHFKLMKPGSCLFNLGRGNCYREEDLVRALKNGALSGAGLDVFREEPLPLSSPLWELPNVIVNPHASAISGEYLDLYMEEWIENVRNARGL